MQICKLCKKKFPTKIVVNGKVKNLQNRKFCLICSPFGKHNTKNLTGDKRKNSIGKDCTCKSCRRNYKYSHTKGHRLDRCNSCVIKEGRLKTKKRMVEIKGGKCEICGYDKCVAALDFHHQNGDKEFGLARAYNKAWSIVEVELDKCIMVCANCHRKIHFKEEWSGVATG